MKKICVFFRCEIPRNKRSHHVKTHNINLYLNCHFFSSYSLLFQLDWYAEKRIIDIKLNGYSFSKKVDINVWLENCQPCI